MSIRVDEIDRLIIIEPDAAERNRLSINRYTLSTLCLTTELLDKMEKKFSKQLEDHEAKLNEHDDLVLKSHTTRKVLAYIFSGATASLFGIAIYGWIFIFNMNKALIEQAIVLPRLESVINEVRLQKQVVVATREVVKQQGESIQDSTEKIDSIDADVAKLQNNKVNKAPKYLIK